MKKLPNWSDVEKEAVEAIAGIHQELYAVAFAQYVALRYPVLMPWWKKKVTLCGAMRARLRLFQTDRKDTCEALGKALEEMAAPEAWDDPDDASLFLLSRLPLCVLQHTKQHGARLLEEFTRRESAV